jgi:hypothetical protein
MDNQEKRRQQKDKERDQKNKADKAYDDAQEKRRPPVNAVWLIAIGIVLTSVILYAWTVGMVRPW